MKMLTSQTVTFYIRRYGMSNVYIPAHETLELIQALTQREHILYVTISGMVLGNTDPKDLKNAALAETTGFDLKTVAKLKSSLKSKGYLVIVFSKNSDNKPLAEVHIGKDQVDLYNVGLRIAISAKGYKNMLKRYPDLLNKDMSEGAQERLIEDINKSFNKDPNQYN